MSVTLLLAYVGTALFLPLMPGPGLLYIAGRTLAAGPSDGVASCIGTAVGGFLHVVAGAIGVSALLTTSAEAFLLLKFLGGAYLIFLGTQAWRSAGPPAAPKFSPDRRTLSKAFRQGVFVEATNPKTAAFFLALIPQFLDPSKPTRPAVLRK
ncbi:LysE family translocator [Pararhizobium sp. PWRC1-1]|uniref:LysE family translocator n=1 Tax=Pararhizobium sp. PWRC1-1 TaxID=2804566 RepID=UPI003CF4B61C